MSDIVLKTIIAEAGGDPNAMAAVAAVIHNRAVAQGKTPEQIVKAKGQFEGYSNPGPASIRAQNDPKVVARASQVWSGIKSGSIADPTNGATMYHADYVKPYWAKSANTNGTVNIGGNIFYKGSGPSTALAAIDQVAPNPQSRPPALGYAQTPSSVRAITVNPNGSPASLLDALTAKYGSATQTPRGASGLSVSGIPLPEAMPVQRPSVPALPSLTSRKVNTVPINPATGNPYTGIELAQQAANTEAARLRGVMPAGRVANIPPVPVPVSSPQSNLQAALNTYAAKQALNRTGVTKTTSAQAGNVALPPGVVPKSAAQDMAAADAILRAKPATANGSAFTGGWGASAFVPKPTIPGPNGTLVAKDQTRLPDLPPTAYLPIAPKPQAVAAIDAATVPLPRVRPTPTVPVPGVTGPQPLTKFLPPSMRQNDTLTTAGNVAGNLVAGTPIGHVYSLLTGAPNTGGGILNGLFGYGGLFNGHPTSAPPPLPSAAPAPVVPNSAYVEQWLNDTYGSARTGESGKGAWAV